MVIATRNLAFFLVALLTIVACSTVSIPPPTAAKPAAPATKAAETPQPTSVTSKTTAPIAQPTSAPAVPTKAPEEVTVKYGDLRIVSDAGVYVALEKGYFKEQGITLELTAFSSAAQMMPALATGQLDAGGGAASAGFFNAIVRDIPLKLVADKGGSYAGGFTSQSLVVRKELIQQGKFKGYADLKGLKIALSAKAASSEISLSKALEKGKLTLNDVDYVAMAHADMPTALSNGSIDAALMVEPYVTIGEEKGLHVRWISSYDFYPDQVIGTLIYAPIFLKKGTDPGNRFMVAYIKGVRDYNDAFGAKKKNLSEVLSVLVKYTTSKDAKLLERTSPSGLNPDGYINVKGVEEDLDWYVKNGHIKEKPKVVDIVDHQYVDYAIKVLGKYQP